MLDTAAPINPMQGYYTIVELRAYNAVIIATAKSRIGIWGGQATNTTWSGWTKLWLPIFMEWYTWLLHMWHHVKHQGTRKMDLWGSWLHYRCQLYTGFTTKIWLPNGGGRISWSTARSSDLQFRIQRNPHWLHNFSPCSCRHCNIYRNFISEKWLNRTWKFENTAQYRTPIVCICTATLKISR